MTRMIGPYELNTAVLGDCIEVMRQIPDNSVDSIVTDSPYGLSEEPDIIEVLTHWLNGDDYEHRGGGFMGKSWDSFVPGPAVWRECYRVLKPGGCLMAFGGTRTCDLLSIAIRLAGFQRFDSLCWLHGQGFGKGADISKKLDQLAGAEREVIGEKPRLGDKKVYPRNANGDTVAFKGAFQSDQLNSITAPATEADALFSGYRSQLKPAHEVIVCFWKPREKSFAFNALKWGVAGLSIDECRIEVSGDDYEQQKAKQHKATMGKKKFGIFGGKNGVTREYEPSTKGRYPANVLISHHESCVRVGVKQVRGSAPVGRPSLGKDKPRNGAVNFGGYKFPDSFGPYETGYADPDGLEVVPDYRCHPDCAVAMLDRQAGVRKTGPLDKSKIKAPNNIYGARPKKLNGTYEASTGSASRFFYTPKAPGREKWFYCEICDDVYPYAEREGHAHGKPKGQRKHQVAHPTVKPLSIVNYTLNVLEYLCRLTKTPTGGIVLDPFGGSGTTALAAIANGRDFLIIENDPIYHRIAEKRIEQAMNEPRQLELV